MWRTVVVSSPCKLDLKMGYMVMRSSGETSKVFIDEISILIIESTAVSITAALINELIYSKIKIIFCDKKRYPCSELISYYGHHETSLNIKKQINWEETIKQTIWQKIVINKILNQSKILDYFGFINESKVLRTYALTVKLNDKTNREGHAAKVYFNTLSDNGYNRKEDNVINSCLNYGYGIILSAISREITAAGYLTQIGIFHTNQYNYFNLSSDFIEPFRIVVDKFVFSRSYAEFDAKAKRDILGILNEKIYIDGKAQTLLNAINIFVLNTIKSINIKEPNNFKSVNYVL